MKNTLLFSLLILTLSCNTKKNNDLIKSNDDSLASTNDNDSIKVNSNDFREYVYPNRFSICFPKTWNIKEVEPNN